MSFPIKYCFLVQAADDDEKFAAMHPIMKRNLDGGHFTIHPCNCAPPCRKLTDEECSALTARFLETPKPRAGQ